MKNKRPKEGALLRIDLDDGTDAFARVLPNSQIAIYALHIPHGSEVIPALVYESSIAFRLTVMKSALLSGKWKTVDQRELERHLNAAMEYSVKDKLTGQYSLYHSSDGTLRSSSYEECKNLEPGAVWEAEHVEERIKDYFAGRPNRWLEQLKNN